MQEIYLDSNATTHPADVVVRAMDEALRRHWANPSSVHRAGPNRLSTTERMCEAESSDSALRGYWEWAYTRAQEVVQRETAWAEEEDHA